MCFGYTQPYEISYHGYRGPVNVSLDGVANDGAPGEHDNVVNVGAVIGTNYNDKLTAGSAGMSLFGGPGNDVLTGGPGSDDLVGGPGDDTLTGGTGADGLVCGLGNDIVTDYLGGTDSEFTCAR
jgi:large repetitive protein